MIVNEYTRPDGQRRVIGCDNCAKTTVNLPVANDPALVAVQLARQGWQQTGLSAITNRKHTCPNCQE